MKRVMKKEGRRHIKGAALGSFGFCTSWAVNAAGTGQEWIEVIELDLEIESLPEQFEDKRIIHISDLHCSNTVSGKYLSRCIDRINQMEADFVVLTGDYITYDLNGRFREKIAGLLSKVKSKHGMFGCMGNHDYGIGGMFNANDKGAIEMSVEALDFCGVKVLRNESMVLEVDGGQIRLVGLGDVWAGDLELEKAFAKVGKNERVIVLAHNPEVVDHLHRYEIDAIMCGHTHGSKFDIPTRNKKGIFNLRTYSSGMYQVGDKKLYVNRGLGRLGRALSSRPEITIFNLKRSSLCPS